MTRSYQTVFRSPSGRGDRDGLVVHTEHRTRAEAEARVAAIAAAEERRGITNGFTAAGLFVREEPRR